MRTRRLVVKNQRRKEGKIMIWSIMTWVSPHHSG